MIITESGKPYDVHEECYLADTCEKYKSLGKFSGCQNIGKVGTCCYCINKPDHQRIKLELAWVSCES